jgi:pilus assembly protein Flp/PilA
LGKNALASIGNLVSYRRSVPGNLFGILLGRCCTIGGVAVALLRYAGLFQENKVMKSINQKSERGASLVEYALLVALIAVVAIAAVRVLGTTVSQQFSTVQAQISG